MINIWKTNQNIPASWRTGRFGKMVDRALDSYWNDNQNAHKRLYEESAKEYQRPELYIGKYNGFKYPIIYNYETALDAARDGVLTPNFEKESQ